MQPPLKQEDKQKDQQEDLLGKDDSQKQLLATVTVCVPALLAEPEESPVSVIKRKRDVKGYRK